MRLLTIEGLGLKFQPFFISLFFVIHQSFPKKILLSLLSDYSGIHLPLLRLFLLFFFRALLQSLILTCVAQLIFSLFFFQIYS